MTVGCAFQRDPSAFDGHRGPGNGQEVGRFRLAALFQLRVDIEFGFGADAVLVHVGHIAPVIALERSSSRESLAIDLFP